MRSFVVSAILAVAAATPAWAQGVGSALDSPKGPRDGARAMLYWQWSPDSRAPAQAGLRFDAPLRVGGFARSVPVLDLGVTRGRTTLRTFGALSFDSSDPGKTLFDSFDGDVVKSPWFWAGVAVVGVGISCATSHWPCQDSGKGSGDTYTPPGASLFVPSPAARGRVRAGAASTY